jgi:DNA-binding transcriptional LysR family regulator
MNDAHKFNRLICFVVTVDSGTITGAAETLGVSENIVSKQLQLLNEDVGATLLLRNNRRLQPTEAGRIFYDVAKSALAQANNANQLVQERNKKRPTSDT